MGKRVETKTSYIKKIFLRKIHTIEIVILWINNIITNVFYQKMYIKKIYVEIKT
jgi:hypothetical protein